jgi:Flp pilus assembly protein TadG
MPGRSTLRRFGLRARSEEGVALVEFAVTLPLIVVLVVGVFDFGAAFNLKQKLINTAREGARFASAIPTNDLSSGGTPNSVLSVRNSIDNYMIAEQINDCGLITQPGAGANLKWTFTTASGANGCPGPMTITIDRSKAAPATVTGATGTINVISTQVTISYPHKWQFGNVVGLIAPGASYANGVGQVSISATVPNID